MDPKDARKLVWPTAPPSDPSDADSDDERYSKPYQPDENGTVPKRHPQTNALSDDVYEVAGVAESDFNYDVPPSHENDYNRLNMVGLHPAVKNRNPIPDVGGSTYNHTPTWNSQKADRQNSGGSGVGEPQVVTRNSSHDISPIFRRSGGVRKGSSSIPDEGRPIPQSNANPSLYEEAWDTSGKKKQFEATLRLARTLSTTSDNFEDAMEYQLEEPAPPPTKPTRAGQKTDSVTGSLYEQAWDLNRGLEEKLRKVQLMHSDAGGIDDASAPDTYQEPWDTPQKQRELEDKLQQASAGGGGPLSPKSQQQPKGSSLYEDAWDIKRNSLTQMMMAGLEGGIMSQASTRSSQSIACPMAGEPVNAMIPLDSQDWYHGNISRDDAENILRVCKNGSYLVRDSSDGIHYTLCIKSPRMMIHIQIDECFKSGSQKKGYILGKNSKVFDTIPAMMDYYSQHPVPIQGADHTVLLYPVQCHWSKS